MNSLQSLEGVLHVNHGANIDYIKSEPIAHVTMIP